MKKVLVTKDILMKAYLPVYGNKYWKTPNIDALAEKGTVFDRYYTAAPSTAMAFTSMVTGKYAYELERKVYQHEEEYTGRTIFDTFIEAGVQNYIIWSTNYNKFALPFANCFRNATIKTLDMNQPVGPHIASLEPLERDEEKARRTLKKLFEVIDEVPDDNVFLWIHLPHTILGRISYGDDIDLLDEIIGYLRKKYGDDSISISADHGNMNGLHGKFCYGFDLNEAAINIPLITPWKGVHRWQEILSNTKLMELILSNEIPKCDYVLSETAYYMQPKRKIAIIQNEYKYEYDKWNQKEKLTDVTYDPMGNINLLEKIGFDMDRKRKINIDEVYFYPYWDKIPEVLTTLRKIFNSIWRQGNKREERRIKIKQIVIDKYSVIQKLFPKKPQKVYRKK